VGQKLTKKLQDEWEAKLSASGFVDCERSIAGIRESRQFASNAFRQMPPVQRAALERYFAEMSAHENDAGLSVFDRTIVRMVAAGSSRTEIANYLDCHPRTVRHHIRRLETLFGVRHWDPEASTTAPRKPKLPAVTRRRKRE
jgi:DNA-binding CsgD family transcriptional regulator